MLPLPLGGGSEQAGFRKTLGHKTANAANKTVAGKAAGCCWETWFTASVIASQQAAGRSRRTVAARRLGQAAMPPDAPFSARHHPPIEPYYRH